ncbi:DNA topoisomerase IB [Microbacterium luticocti]|uniref:DNA topoisomerase IB n=1 Tax=Microbacterium luticocti TaxID=451764 RepID=UPI00040C2D8E|nr:DNA topoisomerase IB [Microbacterium luticocti]
MVRVHRAHPHRDPGIRRIAAGSGFRFVDARGNPVDAVARARIDALVIPPAWTDVWISADPVGHIQAVGTDDAGRRQYIYHPAWTARRERGKFARALALAEALPGIRGQVTRALRAPDITRERVLAAAIRMLDAGALRIGGEQYLTAHGSHGLVTLQCRHARVDEASVRLAFPAKSGQRMEVTVDDPDLVALLAELIRGRPRAPLLAYRRGRRRVPIRSRDVNGELARLSGGRFTAKDFRTLRGTIAAAQALALHDHVDGARGRAQAERLAAEAAAEVLGNTVAVARRSYIDPRVFERFERGRLLELDGSPEAALVRLLR